MLDGSLISQVFLWILVSCLGVLLLGAYRQIAVLQGRLEEALAGVPDDTLPLERDGPMLGSAMPELHVKPARPGEGTLSLRPVGSRATIIAFLSTTCRACEFVVEPLDQLAGQGNGPRVILILRSSLTGCAEFVRLFDVRSELICDTDTAVTREFGVHRNPFALLYDNMGTLVNKGTISGPGELDALLHGQDSGTVMTST